MLAMAEEKKARGGRPTKKDKVGSANVKYVTLPVDLWQELKDWADIDERSVSWAVKKAVREFLDKQKLGDAS